MVKTDHAACANGSCFAISIVAAFIRTKSEGFTHRRPARSSPGHKQTVLTWPGKRANETMPTRTFCKLLRLKCACRKPKPPANCAWLAFLASGLVQTCRICRSCSRRFRCHRCAWLSSRAATAERRDSLGMTRFAGNDMQYKRKQK